MTSANSGHTDDAREGRALESRRSVRAPESLAQHLYSLVEEEGDSLELCIGAHLTRGSHGNFC